MRVTRFTFILLTVVLAIAAVTAQVLLTAPPPQPPQARAPEGGSITAEGRVVAQAGAETVVGSELVGTIDSIEVVVNQPVRRGSVIARIRNAELRAAVAEAEARVSEAASELRLAESEMVRARELWSAQVGTLQQYERALRDGDLARARQRSAGAQLNRLQASLQKSVILAPIDGIIVERTVEPGEAVDIGSPIATIVDPTRFRVDAEVDELDVARTRPGVPVRIAAEGFDRQWSGRVVEVPFRVVGRSVKPADPAQPVDTRVLMVGVELLEPTPLKLGQRVDVEISR